MNKNLVTSVLIFLGSMLALTACDESDVPLSAAPRYGNMVFNPTMATPGDSVTVTVEQAKKGVSLESTNYTWRISYGFETEEGDAKDTIVVLHQHTNYDAAGQADPSVRFLVPSNCSSRFVSVSLLGEFSGYSGPTLFFQATKTGTLSVR